MTKKEQAKKFWEQGANTSAIKILSGFRFGVTKEQKSSMELYLGMIRSERDRRFYEDLGNNFEEVVQEAFRIAEEILRKF